MRVYFVHYMLEIKLISRLVHYSISNYNVTAFTP